MERNRPLTKIWGKLAGGNVRLKDFENLEGVIEHISRQKDKNIVWKNLVVKIMNSEN